MDPKRSLLPQKVTTHVSRERNLQPHSQKQSVADAEGKSSSNSRPGPVIGGSDITHTLNKGSCNFTANAQPHAYETLSRTAATKTPFTQSRSSRQSHESVNDKTSRASDQSGHKRNAIPQSAIRPIADTCHEVRIPSSKLTRPAFTAFKQHYSPKKQISRHPGGHPPQSSSEGLSREILALQIELAYLHLLHEPSAAVHSQWTISTEKCHRKAFEALAKWHHDLKQREVAQQVQRNAKAIRDWAGNLTALEASKQIKSLSSNLSTITELLRPESRYSRAIILFESWFERAQELRAKRCDDTTDEGQPLEFIEDLGDGWHVEMGELERKLNICARDLYMVRDAKPGSDLARIVTLCRTAAEGMLDEVRLTQAIERSFMAQEREWISSGIGKLV